MALLPSDSELGQIDVLMVDDQPDSCDDILFGLRRAGLRVHICNGVGKALDLFDRNEQSERRLLAGVQVVILDVMMPGHASFKDHQDGMLAGVSLFEVVQRSLPQVGVVMLTNSTSREIQNRIPFDQLRILYRQKFGTISSRMGGSKHGRNTAVGELVNAVMSAKQMPTWVTPFHWRLCADAEELPPGSSEGELMAAWFEFCKVATWRNMPKPSICGILDSHLALTWTVANKGQSICLLLGSDPSAKVLQGDEEVYKSVAAVSGELKAVLWRLLTTE